MLDTLIGGAIGGVLRLAPEVLGYLDRKDRRKHEILLADKQQAAAVAQADGEFRTAALTAHTEATKAQGAQTGVRWVDGLNALIRPLITIQWVILLYPLSLALQWYALFQAGVDLTESFAEVFGPAERGLCAGIINFWFLNRVFERALK